jgi:FkbM family methyltransferase
LNRRTLVSIHSHLHHLLFRGRSAMREMLGGPRANVQERVNRLWYAKPVVLENACGVRFILEPWDTAAKSDLVSGEFYRDEFSALKKLINKGDTVFGLGANIGFHATLFSRFGGTSRVLTFEPVPETAWRLRETLALSRCANVETFEFAILDRSGYAERHIFSLRYAARNSFGKPAFCGARPNGVTTTGVRWHPAEGSSRSDSGSRRLLQRRAHRIIRLFKVNEEGFEKSVILRVPWDLASD